MFSAPGVYPERSRGAVKGCNLLIIDSHAYCFQPGDALAGYSTVEEHLAWLQTAQTGHHQPAFRTRDRVPGSSDILGPETPTDWSSLPDVNFRIEYPVTILVLNPNNYRPGQLPDAATIPIMDKGDWLFFLHTTAWAGSWDYVIHFDDGTTETIEMRCPVNMRDWTAGGSASSFRFDEETSTAAAWTGTTKSFPKVTIYRTAWENPKPDRRIDKIDMVGRKGVPGLLAVTLGRK